MHPSKGNFFVPFDVVFFVTRDRDIECGYYSYSGVCVFPGSFAKSMSLFLSY